MHKLSEIQILNYRSCKNASLPLDDFTPIVGYNNAGKSNILSAIKWLLKPSALTTDDFYDTETKVEITGIINGLSDEILDRLPANQSTAIKPYCPNGSLQIRRVLNAPGAVKKIQNLVRDPKVLDKSADDAWQKFPTGIPQALNVLFPTPVHVGAMENVTDDVGKSKSGSTIGELIKNIITPVYEAHGEALQASLDDIGKRLSADGQERAQELKDFDEEASTRVEELFPGLSIRLHVPPPTLQDLLKLATVRAKEEDFDWQHFTSLGHGAQRSIQMALIRYLAEIKSTLEENASRTLLLIDEPELYLHPQGIEQVRVALKSLSQINYQVVFSTHSPLLIHQDEISNTLIVNKNNVNGTQTKKPLSSAISEVITDGPSQTRTLFEFGNAAQILFCDRVLITEGTTERALIPDVFSTLKGKTLGQSRFALVGLGGSGSICKSLKILNAMTIDSKAVADLDFAFKEAPKTEILNAADPDITAAKIIFQRIAEPMGIDLGHDGFPTRRGELNASEAFAAFAKEADGEAIANNLHDKLLNSNIWLWKKGAIEHHLGLTGKTEADWAHFRTRLRDEVCEDVISEIESVRQFLDWLEQ